MIMTNTKIKISLARIDASLLKDNILI
jgi:hypothetical protein